MKKHFNDIRSIMTEDDFKQLFKMKCSEGTPEDIAKILEENTSVEFNLTQALLIACTKGNLPIVQYFLETPALREKINLYVPYQAGPPNYVGDGVLLHSHFTSQPEVVDYLLYNINFDVSRDTRTYLKFHQINDLLHKIEKQDLFHTMNKEMNKPEEKEKNNKPKL